MDLKASLHEELARLEGELREDPRFVKIERIKALLEVYGDPEPRKVQVGMKFVASLRAHRVPGMEGEEAEGSKSARARLAIKAFLADGPQGRQAILRHLVEQKILGHEKRPDKQLGSYLSRFHEFETNGTGRWQIKRQAEGVTSPGASHAGDR